MVKLKRDGTAEQRILAAAKKVFVSNGLAGARMQDIADEAGINKALLHYYFKNKEKLFEMIFNEVAKDFFPVVNNIFESDEPLFNKIESFCSIYIDKIMSDPYIPIFILSELSQRPKSFVRKVVQAGPPKPSKLLLQIDSDIKEGRIKPIAPVQLLMNMISMCIFPFIGKPMMITVLNLNDAAFNAIMEARKKDVPRFIIDSIKM